MNQRLPAGKIFLLACIALWTACAQNATEKNPEYAHQLTFGPGDESRIAEAFLSLKDNSSILLKAGRYAFDNLSLAQLKHIQIRGEGADKTILDFSGQTTGGEGIRATDITGLTIEDLQLQNAKGDLLKVSKSRDLVFRNLRAIWEKSDSTSGGYALYPVMCVHVLMENCYVQGSSDAGIYVGQSDSAVVRNCKGYANVAGGEIENTTHAEVYNNEFWGNCAGFLVFDLPDLSKRGGFVKAHDNFIHDNNERNFAKAGSFGTSWGVGNAAPGSGVIILAASNVELYNNRIINNNSGAILLASGLAVDDSALNRINNHYFPISRNLSIHDNVLEMGDAFPAPAYEHHMGKLLVGVEQMLNRLEPARKNRRIPMILYDGISTNLLNGGKTANPDSLCIRQAGDNVFVNADLLHLRDPQHWHPNTMMAPYVCDQK